MPMTIVLRLIHIGAGVFWGGAVLYFSTMLEPCIRASGAEGAKVMQALIRRGHLTLLPVLALLTLVSGIELLRQASGGFLPAWFRSGPGLGYGAGAAAGVLAFLVGMLVMRPAALRLGPLVQQAATADAQAKAGLQARIEALRRRALVGGRAVAVLIAVAVISMAVSRYLP